MYKNVNFYSLNTNKRSDNRNTRKIINKKLYIEASKIFKEIQEKWSDTKHDKFTCKRYR